MNETAPSVNSSTLPASASGEVVRLSATVRGHVQGVGFRYFTHHTAHSIGSIAGMVRNGADGTVEVEAEASDRAPLEKLLHDLHIGPGPAQVTEVTAIWEDATSPRYSGEFQVA